MKKLILALSAVLMITASASANNGTLPINGKKVETTLNLYKSLMQKTFKWEVETNYGNASGTTASLEKAKKIITTVGKKDITTYKIIVSY